MSQLHLEVLSEEQLKTLKLLGKFKKDATLAGGTALSLQLGHRYSFDFDLFFPRELGRKDILKMRKALRIKEVGLNTTEQINIITADNILINLVYYPFKPLFRKKTTISLPLFNIKDIALDKAYTIGKRAAWRDYVDMFILLKGGYISLGEIFKIIHKKFGPEFSERLFLEQLVYFEDLKTTKISFFGSSYSDEEIKEFLVGEVKKYKKEAMF